MQKPATIEFVLAATVLIASASVRAQDLGDMARCAELENKDARVACYDEVMGRNSSSMPDSQADELEPVGISPSREPIPLTEEFGQEQVEGKPETDSTIVRGRVTSCQQDANDKWYFYFENGQVWKQRSRARLRSRDCDFWVTISRDTLGYKMQIEGDEKQIRVGRIR